MLYSLPNLPCCLQCSAIKPWHVQNEAYQIASSAIICLTKDVNRLSKNWSSFEWFKPWFQNTQTGCSEIPIHSWQATANCMCLVQREQLHLVSAKYASPANSPVPTLVLLVSSRWPENNKRRPYRPSYSLGSSSPATEPDTANHGISKSALSWSAGQVLSAPRLLSSLHLGLLQCRRSNDMLSNNRF